MNKQRPKQPVKQKRTTPARPARQPRIPAIIERFWLAATAVVVALCGLTGFSVTLGAAWLLQSSAGTTEKITVVDTNRPIYATSPLGAEAATVALSPVFTAEVQYWEALIKAWAAVYQVDPNLIATVIQIESCGDPLVSSPSGAQGLFQVMPFHFDPGEDMLDVETNARRGMNYLVGSLDRADGHAGLALAGYNGGHGVISRGWAGWAAETQRYYYWGSRIYAEAISGMETSPTLAEWLSAGGQNLCTRAGQTLQQIQAEQARAITMSTG